MLQSINEKQGGTRLGLKLEEELRTCTKGGEEDENSMSTLQHDERPHIDDMYVHTHKVLGVDDRERGRQMKVRGK